MRDGLYEVGCLFAAGNRGLQKVDGGSRSRCQAEVGWCGFKEEIEGQVRVHLGKGDRNNLREQSLSGRLGRHVGAPQNDTRNTPNR